MLWRKGLAPGLTYALALDLIVEQEDTIARLRRALERYAECYDGCTCGYGWSHAAAREALEFTP